jgi:hypothetical protein
MRRGRVIIAAAATTVAAAAIHSGIEEQQVSYVFTDEFNLAIGGDGDGPVPESFTQSTMTVDDVRAW